MTQALMKGADGTSKRERGHRLQPAAPEFLTRSSATLNLSTHIATVRSGQEENRKPVCSAVDAARREITNAGHLAKAIGGIHALKRLRYGRKRVPVDAARDLYRVLAAVEAAAMVRNPKFSPDLHEWSARHLCLSETAKAEIRADLEEFPEPITPLSLGQQLDLTDDERDRTKFWGAEVAGMTAEAREERKRIRDRVRKQVKRSSSRKGEALALARQLYPNVSRATLFRRARELKGASNA